MYKKYLMACSSMVNSNTNLLKEKFPGDIIIIDSSLSSRDVNGPWAGILVVVNVRYDILRHGR